MSQHDEFVPDDFTQRWAPTLYLLQQDTLKMLEKAETQAQILDELRAEAADLLGTSSTENAAGTYQNPSENAAGAYQNPNGGLNDAGRKHFGVKKGVTNYSSASEGEKKRWVRWALRFTKTPRPLKDDQGRPTRYALMFKAWGEAVPTSDSAVHAVHKKAETRSKALGMGENAAQDDTGLGEAYLYSSDNDFWEDVVRKDEDGTDTHTGVMVAFYPTDDEADTLSLDGGEKPHDLHLTLAYLGSLGAEVAADQTGQLDSAVRAWAATQPPVTARTAGIGVFNEDPPVTFAAIDSPQLPAVRASLLEALDQAGIPAIQTHGFIPHVTLTYADERDAPVPDMNFTFDAAHLIIAGRDTTIPLTGHTPQPGAMQPLAPSQQAQIDRQIVENDIPRHNRAAQLQVSERGKSAPLPLKSPTTTAFATEINGRQMIAAPADVIAHLKREGSSLREPTVEDIAAEHMMWIHGRFVGAEVPNRNGALWSAGDLELSRNTVTHGPLNWLHEAKHVIGSIGQADYVPAGIEGASTSMTQPHIAASAAIWKWVWPDEAYVVQQASDAGMLWYSMECISSQVACAGEGGCGATSSYSEYMAGAACEHVRQRASARQFLNPVFLGGAVIVPPTRPGWAEADARVMSTANALAEAAFEQAGQPDIPASQWEQMMAQLVIAAS